jgi:hypothetical protein
MVATRAAERRVSAGSPTPNVMLNPRKVALYHLQRAQPRSVVPSNERKSSWSTRNGGGHQTARQARARSSGYPSPLVPYVMVKLWAENLALRRRESIVH